MEMTKENAQQLSRIARRASKLHSEITCRERDVISFLIDLDHAPELKLDELESADDGNFAHDMFGIMMHLNHDTKQLENCFWPRYAK